MPPTGTPGPPGARRRAHQHRSGRGQRDGRAARGAPRLVAGAAAHRPVGDAAGTARGAARSTRPSASSTCCARSAGTSAHVNHHAAIAVDRPEAARDIASGRPQPGAVEIPIDLQYATGEVRVGDPHPPIVQAPAQAPLERAAELLAAATRPLIWAGGGVVSAGASAELTALAERLGAPVLTSVEGRGAIAEDHPLALGPQRRPQRARSGDRRCRRRAGGRDPIPARQQLARWVCRSPAR